MWGYNLSCRWRVALAFPMMLCYYCNRQCRGRIGAAVRSNRGSCFPMVFCYAVKSGISALVCRIAEGLGSSVWIVLH